jgi:hypothetical protein
MTNYPLNWGWDQPDTSKASTADAPKPRPTLLGGHEGDVNVAAAGDLRCEGIPGGGGCSTRKGDWGATAMYGFDAGKMCAKCAVRYIGEENSSPAEQLKALAPYLLGR